MRQIPQHPCTSAPIGIFDSGVGGISILKEIQKKLPHENLIYIADSLNAPYGDKSRHFIQQQSLKLANFLIQQQGSKALVIACNTATTEAIQFLRAQLSVPVVGVEPAIKPAAKISKNKVIGILATHRTINSQRLQELVQCYASDSTIIATACPGLVETVESLSSCGDTALLHTDDLIRKYTQAMLEQQADTVVLGCTHYPFLRQQISAIIGADTTILDTGKPVALQLQRILQHHQIHACPTQTGQTTFFSSLNDLRHHQTIHHLWGQPVTIRTLPPII